MQMVKNIVIIIVVVWFGLVAFMPKKALYYRLEEELAKQDIKLNEKLIDESLFSLRIEDVNVYVKGINIASIREINLFTLLFYSHLSIDEVNLDSSLGMLAKDIGRSDIFHSISSPTNLVVDVNSSIAKVDGLVDLAQRKVRLDIENSPNIKMIRPMLKKDEKGWYYETNF